MILRPSQCRLLLFRGDRIEPLPLWESEFGLVRVNRGVSVHESVAQAIPPEDANRIVATGKIGIEEGLTVQVHVGPDGETKKALVADAEGLMTTRKVTFYEWLDTAHVYARPKG